MNRFPAVVALVAALLAFGACSSDDDLSRAAARAATAAGVRDAADVLGAGWEQPGTPPAPDTIIAARCGDPRAGLRVLPRGLIDRVTSPVWFGETHMSPTRQGHARTAVTAYRNGARARVAFRALKRSVFERCLVAAVTTYVHGGHPDSEPVPDPTNRSFAVSSSSVSAGDAAVMYDAKFDEDILGGSDNSHAVSLFVARSGPLLVTALAASSSQNEGPGRARSLARRLGTSALARASAASAT